MATVIVCRDCYAAEPGPCPNHPHKQITTLNPAVLTHHIGLSSDPPISTPQGQL